MNNSSLYSRTAGFFQAIKQVATTAASPVYIGWCCLSTRRAPYIFQKQVTYHVYIIRCSHEDWPRGGSRIPRRKEEPTESCNSVVAVHHPRHYTLVRTACRSCAAPACRLTCYQHDTTGYLIFHLKNKKFPRRGHLAETLVSTTER